LPFSSPISRFAPTYAVFNGDPHPIKSTLKYDIIAHRATDCVNPLQNIMVLWSNHQFPQGGVNCADSNGAGYIWNATQLQYEHAKAQDRICNRVFGSSIADDVFETTMPCVHFSPHASGPKSLNNIDNNLSIKFTGGDKTYLPTLNFVITSTAILKVMPSGDIVTMNGTTR
jgi:hypothetical protein